MEFAASKPFKQAVGLRRLLKLRKPAPQALAQPPKLSACAEPMTDASFLKLRIAGAGGFSLVDFRRSLDKKIPLRYIIFRTLAACVEQADKEETMSMTAVSIPLITSCLIVNCSRITQSSRQTKAFPNHRSLTVNCSLLTTHYQLSILHLSPQ
jgi:hypothetical protein